MHSLLISTDNLFFWNKCSLYAYQTPPLIFKLNKLSSDV